MVMAEVLKRITLLLATVNGISFNTINRQPEHNVQAFTLSQLLSYSIQKVFIFGENKNMKTKKKS